jgi:hypothetical protein
MTDKGGMWLWLDDYRNLRICGNLLGKRILQSFHPTNPNSDNYVASASCTL